MTRAAILVGLLPILNAQNTDGRIVPEGSAATDSASATLPLSAGSPKRADYAREGIDWNGLFADSAMYLGVQHGFRLATEPGTRDMKGSFWKGYGGSIGSLRGWSDGDPFLVNYIGHTLQGSAAGYVWANNDRKYFDVEFGKDTNYWKSRLRSTAWSFIYSAQFEIGPASEASIGYIQKYYPQFGFTDLVVTPAIGMGWMVAEDAIDRYVIRAFEDRVRNKYARIMVRGWLNPSRSFANMMAFRAPWDRNSRPGTQRYDGRTYREIFGPTPPKAPEGPKPLVAPFETAFTVKARKFNNQSWNNSCVGGGSNMALRFAESWQVVFDVDGCQMLGLDERRSFLTGDSISYLMGPRWTPAAGSRFSPYAEVLIGGIKMTQERFTPTERKRFEEDRQAATGKPPDYTLYADVQSTHGFQLQAGTGVDLRLGRAFAWRVASVSYAKSWTQPLNGVEYRDGVLFSSGLILRLGTW